MSGAYLNFLKAFKPQFVIILAGLDARKGSSLDIRSLTTSEYHLEALSGYMAEHIKLLLDK